MKHLFIAALLAGNALIAGAITPVDFSRVKITDEFWAPRIKNHAVTTVATCIDQIENQTGRIRNFENAANRTGNHSGIFFDDSDVYKALEGIAYTLINAHDPNLETTADSWIDKIAAAQDQNGYINTYFTLAKPDERWTDMDKHEMYCAGHMIEAGIAYKKATGKDKLLKVGQRMADHMMSLFGPGKRHWVPGHEEIELALCKLAAETGEEKYLDFAHFLLEERGHGHGTLGPKNGGRWNAEYYQDITPVAQLTDISGHAVRCMYLYSGMADYVAASGDTTYMAPLRSLWHDVVDRNMYVTGGIGSSGHNEGFTEDYDLPNLEAYCETCASVGMILWNHRMNSMTPDSKYTDVLERALYNGALAGISLNGNTFFYVNPLESKGDHHRQEWYGCACCPSQICRFLPSVGGYIYSVSPNTIWVNQYIGSEASMPDDKWNVKMSTSYPYQGTVNISLQGPKGKQDLRLRIPGWCDDYKIMKNGKTLKNVEIENGYAIIPNCKSGDSVTLDMEMPVKMVAADPRVKADEGKRAVTRGPLVYCVEECDNPQSYDANLSSASNFSVGMPMASLNGALPVTADNGTSSLRLVPYYAWDNREAGKMKVWINYNE